MRIAPLRLAPVAAVLMACLSSQAGLNAQDPVISGTIVTEEADGGRLSVTANRSIVVTTGFDIRRVSITNPDVADATVVSPRELLLNGKAPGTISLIVWGPSSRVHYALVVEPA